MLDRIWGRLAVILGSGFGTGAAPFAPATFGTLPGILIAWGMHRAAIPIWAEAVIIGLMALAGVAICHRAAQEYGVEDPGAVVWDEIAATPIVFCLVPVTGVTALVGFVWFRVFDIWKPIPARNAERLPGGLGIMADDQVAAWYACAATYASFLWLGEHAFAF